MNPIFRFSPVSFSWVAIHPNPKGVIQFIGGAFFGTFPTIFYRYFLQTLFEEGYTIIALPFRFSFRHWSIAIELLAEQEILRHHLAEASNRLGYQSSIYQQKNNYFWLGHSLGCKYISLLEFLSNENWQDTVNSCLKKSDNKIVIDLTTDSDRLSILDQPSLLIAPDISDTESAIPVKFVAQILDRIGLGVKPTRKETQCLIERSNLFNLTALISFDKDTLAGSETDISKSIKIQAESDVLWLIKELNKKNLPILHQELKGKHLEPLGIRFKNYIIDLNPFDKFIEAIKNRRLESVTIHFLDELRKRQQGI
jgi:Protein of unknown function (DUF1350)